MVTPSPSQVFAGPEKWTEKAPDGDTSPSLSLVPITIFKLLQSTCTTVALFSALLQYLGDPTMQVPCTAVSLLLMDVAVWIAMQKEF